MERMWIILIALGVFLLSVFIFWRMTNTYAQKGYGTKMWKHWSTRLYYWQAAIFYSIGFTTITMYLLKWSKIVSF